MSDWAVDTPSCCCEGSLECQCTHLHYAGEVMVGDHLSGGPEPMFRCSMNRNMDYYRYHGVDCPDYWDGYEASCPWWPPDDDTIVPVTEDEYF